MRDGELWLKNVNITEFICDIFGLCCVSEGRYGRYFEA